MWTTEERNNSSIQLLLESYRKQAVHTLSLRWPRIGHPLTGSHIRNKELRDILLENCATFRRSYLFICLLVYLFVWHRYSSEPVMVDLFFAIWWPSVTITTATTIARMGVVAVKANHEWERQDVAISWWCGFFALCRKFGRSDGA